MARGDSGSGVAAFLLFVLAMGIFFLLPGLLLAFSAAAVLGVTLDTGQLWVFGASVCAAPLLTAWLARGPFFAFGWYGGACLFSAWVVAVSYWGMHADWPTDFVALALPGVRG